MGETQEEAGENDDKQKTDDVKDAGEEKDDNDWTLLATAEGSLEKEEEAGEKDEKHKTDDVEEKEVGEVLGKDGGQEEDDNDQIPLATTTLPVTTAPTTLATTATPGVA